MAHITGGGIAENLARVLPAGLAARIERGAWRRPQIFDWLAATGNVGGKEMLRTFNCGLGMIVCVAAEDLDAALELLRARGEEAFAIGEIVPRDAPKAAVEIV